MPAKASLRAVPDSDGEDDDASPPTRNHSVSSAAACGSRRDLLVALRDRIASEMDGDVQARDLASLSLRLMAIVRELEELDSQSEGDVVGDAAETPDENFDPEAI